MGTLEEDSNSGNAESKRGERLAQFKKTRLDALRLKIGDEDFDKKIAEIILEGKEPLLVEAEDLAVDKEHIWEHQKLLADMYMPMIESVVKNKFLSEMLALARIGVDWAELNMLQFRESDSGSVGAQRYDDATIAQMDGEVAAAKRFLKNMVLLRGAGWGEHKAYKEKVEAWAHALDSYDTHVFRAKKCIEENKNRQKQKPSQSGESGDFPNNGNDIVSQGIVGQGPLGDFFNP